MAPGPGHRRVHRHGAALREQLLERDIVLVGHAGLLAWRVTHQRLPSDASRPVGHDGAYMSVAHDAERHLRAVEAHVEQRGDHVLGHRRRVASGGVLHLDSGALTPGYVDLVGADGGCGYEAHSRAFEQFAAAAGARAYHQRVGVGHELRGEAALVDPDHFGQPVEAPVDKGYVLVDYDLHQ